MLLLGQLVDAIDGTTAVVVASVLLLLPALAVVIARRMRPDGENIVRVLIAGTFYAVVLLLLGLSYGLQLLTHTEQPSVVCALYIWLALSPLVAAGCIVAARQEPRFGDGKCQACGYDLRGITDRCPECGDRPESIN